MKEGEDVKEDFTVSTKVNDWPYRSFKQFKNAANKFAGGNYWMTIQILLERSKRLEMYESYTEEEVVDEEQEESPKVVTLGGYTE